MNAVFVSDKRERDQDEDHDEDNTLLVFGEFKNPE
jgi:hypothetical protein